MFRQQVFRLFPLIISGIPLLNQGIIEELNLKIIRFLIF